MKQGRKPGSGGAGRPGRGRAGKPRHARAGKRGRAVRGGSAVRGGWAGRKWRWVRPDRNPLRRRSDRVESFIFGGLLVIAAVGAPTAAALGGHWAHAAAQRAARVQRETSHPVGALLLAVPAMPPNGYSVTATVAAQARWNTPAGALRTGEISVPESSVKGETVTIWTDQAGDVKTPPMTPAQVADQGTFGAASAAVLIVAAMLVAAGITRLLVNRRRIAAWDADWAVTAPMWTRQS